MSSNKTIDDLRFHMAVSAINNEVNQHLEIFEACIHIPPVSISARIKLLAINLAKDIHHLKIPHKNKLLILKECNDYMTKLLADAKDHPHE